MKKAVGALCERGNVERNRMKPLRSSNEPAEALPGNGPLSGLRCAGQRLVAEINNFGYHLSYCFKAILITL